MTDLSRETAHFSLSWQQQLQQAFNNINDLCHYLNLNPNELNLSDTAAQQFALRVPLSFAECMEKGNAQDPLLKQVLPINDELQHHEDFTLDPVGDLAAAVQTGVLHKYQGRVLLINTGSCAINCRYCFRRNFPYSELQLTKQQQDHALKTIANNQSIHEVIFSGGDPLLLNDERLSYFIEQLNTITHVKRIRIHSRVPIVLPARITHEFLNTLNLSQKKIVLVVHCNHANELNPRVYAACQSIKQHGITLLNQSVLLKGINDNVQTLTELSEKLFDYGILPYYLHLLDKATGTAHFDVSKTQALDLMQQLQNQLSGYLVPKLVQEIAGEKAKQSVT